MKLDNLGKMSSLHVAFPFMAFALTSLRRLGWWWFWGCEVCLSAAGAGRRFHSSPEFSPPECLVEAHHTTRWRCTSSTSAAHPLAAPFHTSRKRQTSQLTLWLSMQLDTKSFNVFMEATFCLLFLYCHKRLKKKIEIVIFAKSSPTIQSFPKPSVFQRLFSSYPFQTCDFATCDENSSSFDNLAGLVNSMFGISLGNLSKTFKRI